MTIAATKRWRLNLLDVKATFLQGKSFVREVYIFPSKEAGVKEGVIWKLLKCVYDLVDASLWYNTLKALILTLGGEIAYDPALLVWKKDGVLRGGGGGGGGLTQKCRTCMGVGGVFGTQNTKVTCTLLYNKGGCPYFIPNHKSMNGTFVHTFHNKIIKNYKK